MGDKKKLKPKIRVELSSIREICFVLVRDNQFKVIDIALHALSGFHLDKFSSETLVETSNALESVSSRLENYKPFRLLVNKLVEERNDYPRSDS